MSIKITVEIDEFDINEVYDHLVENINYISNTKRLELIQTLREGLDDCFDDEFTFTVDTLDDRTKAEHLLEVFNKYSLTEIETKLPK